MSGVVSGGLDGEVLRVRIDGMDFLEEIEQVRCYLCAVGFVIVLDSFENVVPGGSQCDYRGVVEALHSVAGHDGRSGIDDVVHQDRLVSVCEIGLRQLLMTEVTSL